MRASWASSRYVVDQAAGLAANTTRNAASISIMIENLTAASARCRRRALQTFFRQLQAGAAVASGEAAEWDAMVAEVSLPVDCLIASTAACLCQLNSEALSHGVNGRIHAAKTQKPLSTR